MSSADLIKGINDIISEGGEMMTIETPQGAQRQLKMLGITVTAEDEALVNAVGLRGHLFYIRGADTPPDKYDFITIPSTGKKYTVIEDATPFEYAGVIVGYEARGK